MAPIGAAREKFYFQFLTTPTSDTPGTTLLLHFNNKRYLFGNVSEGTQRACIQRGIGLKKVRQIFLTGQVIWEKTGGLIGMILTMADVRAAEKESEKLQSASTVFSTNTISKLEVATEQNRSLEEGTVMIHGGENLMHTMACARGFVFRKGMPVSINEFQTTNETNLEKPTWSDENVQVWAMPIVPSTSEIPDNQEIESSEANAPNPETSPGTRTRKRSHDQFEHGDAERFAPHSPGKHLREQEIRQSIVSDMFDSRWNRDTLIETPLADVKLPAAIFVRDPETKKLTSYHMPSVDDGKPLPDIKVLVRSPWPSALIADLPPVRNVGFKSAMSYIVQGYPQRGKFDPKRAVALGVRKGPLFSSLTSGDSVTSENGNIITPDMVLGPTKPGRGIAIVELPSRRYVSNLLSRPEWKSEQLKAGIGAICWILAPGVAADPELGKFMESMSSVEHIISSVEVCPDYLALDSSAASAIRLSRVSKVHFPVPFHDNVTVPQSNYGKAEKVQQLSEFKPADRGLKIEVEPKFLIKKDEIPPLLITAEVVKNLPQNVQHYARLAHKKLAAEMGSLNSIRAAGLGEGSNFDPEIITLGTGSALPSKYRNVSATLLRTGKYGNFLFDCGENTIGQLRRVFDPDSVRDILRNLKLIWLSHLHADHHLGTVSVLAAHRQLFIEDAQNRRDGGMNEKTKQSECVVVASGGRMLKFLKEYESVETLGNIRPLLCEPYKSPIIGEEDTSFMYTRLGVQELRTREVEHCTGAQAISITFVNGFKFSYSGDCRPSVAFAAMGKGSDVLVHEATFDDDMAGDALAKKHCTTGEALAVAAKMEAKNVILTHFSQRYQKLPVMKSMNVLSLTKESSGGGAEGSPPFPGIPGTPSDRNLTLLESQLIVEKTAPLEMGSVNALLSHVPKLDTNICVAFDYMRVRVSEIKHMQEFTPALAALFEAETKKSVDETATPQERSNTINRAKGLRKTQQRKDVDREGSKMTDLEQGSSRKKSQQGTNTDNNESPMTILEASTWRSLSDSGKEQKREKDLEKTAVRRPDIDALYSTDMQSNSPP